jgi:hypothetical protein
MNTKKRHTQTVPKKTPVVPEAQTSAPQEERLGRTIPQRIGEQRSVILNVQAMVHLARDAARRMAPPPDDNNMFMTGVRSTLEVAERMLDGVDDELAVPERIAQ